MPGYVEADLIQARKPITDQAGRGLAYCVLGHLEVEQREAPTSDRAETIRALQVNIATFDGVEPEAEATRTDPAPTRADEAAGPTPAPVPLPAPPASAPTQPATDAYALSRASMSRTLAHSGIKPVGGQPASAGVAGGVAASTTSMQRTLARMGVRPGGEA